MTEPQTGRIFISYRRADSAGYAGRVYDRLAAHFGKEAIFMDVDTIQAGLDFVDVLENAVQSCDVVVALLGRQWLNIKDEAGNRRLDNPQDFVRIEVAAALTRNIRVIPVLVDGTPMPNSDQLPSNLKSLARRNAVLVNHYSFHADTTRLIEQLELALKAAEESKILKAKKIKEEEVQKKRRAEIENLLSQADIALELQDWELAKEKLASTLTLEPNHAQAQVKLAIIERKQQEGKEKAEQEAAEKAAREKAETEQKAKEEADRLAKQKTEDERIAKIKLEEERSEKEKQAIKEKNKKETEQTAKKNAKTESSVNLEEEQIANTKEDARQKNRFELKRLLRNSVASQGQTGVLKWGAIGIIGLCIFATGAWGAPYLAGLINSFATEAPATSTTSTSVSPKTTEVPFTEATEPLPTETLVVEPTGPLPTEVVAELSCDIVYAAGNQGEGIYAINMGEGKILDVVKTSLYNNRYIAWNNVRNEIYIAANNGGVVSIIKPDPLQETSTIEENVGWNAYSIAVSPGGDTIYITFSLGGDSPNYRRVVVLDPVTKKSLHVVKLDDTRDSSFLTLSPDGEQLYVSWDSNLDVYSTSNMLLAQRNTNTTIESGRLLASQDGKHLYIVQSNKLIKWEVDTQNIVAEIPLTVPWSGTMVELSKDGKMVYVVTDTGINIVSTSLDEVGFISVDSPISVKESSDGLAIYVTTRDSIFAIDLRTGETIRSLKIENAIDMVVRPCSK